MNFSTSSVQKLHKINHADSVKLSYFHTPDLLRLTAVYLSLYAGHFKAVASRTMIHI